MYTKSNVFKIKDSNMKDELDNLISNLSMDNSNECLLNQHSENEFSFYCDCDNIWGYPVSEDEDGDIEYSYDYFINQLQKLLSKDSHIEIEEELESGKIVKTIVRIDSCEHC